MKTRVRIWLLSCAVLTVILSTACTTPSLQIQAQYDFGPLGAPATLKKYLPPIVVTEAVAPGGMDSTRMTYRLDYADERQVHSYAHSRWLARPAELFTQRVKMKIAQSGNLALSPADGTSGQLWLRINLENFTHVFDSPNSSSSLLTARMTLLRGNSLIAQQTFSQRVPAKTQDAPGGAAAMALAADALIDETMFWLVTETAHRK